MKLIFFLLPLLVISNESYYISNPSILLVDYYFSSSNTDSRMIITINNNRYRESTVIPSQQGYYPIYLQTGKYFIGYQIEGSYEDVYFKSSLEEGQLFYGTNTLDDIVIKDNWILLDQLNYYYNIKHQLNIYTMLNYIQNDLLLSSKSN